MTSNTYNDTNTHNPMSGNATHNTHNPFTGDGVVNTHNPLTGDKTGPHPPPGTNPITGRTKDGELGRNEQQHPGAGHTGAGITSGTNTHNAHNTHNPMTGNGVTNTHNPMTGDATGPHPTSGATHTGAGHVGTTGTNTHNTHNPLTSDGVHNTHNPMTGDKTGPNPPPGTNPMTGRTHDGNLGRHEQHGVGHTGMTGTGPDTTTGITGTHTGAGNVGTMGSGSHNTHNTHNPLTGDGVNNTHNPVTGDKTGPHPPAGTNPVTGRTNEGDLGRHDQRGVGQTGVTGTNPTAVRDTTHGTHTTGTHTGTHTGAHTGAHTTSNQTSGGGAKAIIGKVEATLGNMLKNPDMHAKGVQKQEEAAAAKAARTEGNATHTGTGTNLPPHAAAVGTAEEPRH